MVKNYSKIKTNDISIYLFTSAILGLGLSAYALPEGAPLYQWGLIILIIVSVSLMWYACVWRFVYRNLSYKELPSLFKVTISGLVWCAIAIPFGLFEFVFHGSVLASFFVGCTTLLIGLIAGAASDLLGRRQWGGDS